MIPFEDLGRLNQPFLENLKQRAADVLHSGWFILGKHVQEFEKEFAAYCKTKHCVGLASGLDALILALNALALPKGADVLVPSNTYIATILAIVQQGFNPILVEPDLRTYNLTAKGLEDALTPKTKAILIVHLYGRPAPMTEIMAFAQAHNLPVVEDCAQAHGAAVKGQPVGSFGAIGAFSFYPTKNLGAIGDGGAVTTSDPLLDDYLRKLRNYGSTKRYHNEIIGFNSRLDELQAAFLLEKLPHLNTINAHKNKLAAIYFEQLHGTDFVLPLPADPGDTHVFHLFNIRHKKRDALKQYLFENGVMSDIHYPIPPHHQKALSSFAFKASYPISEEIHATTLSLPLSFCHTEQDIKTVCSHLLAWKAD